MKKKFNNFKKLFMNIKISFKKKILLFYNMNKRFKYYKINMMNFKFLYKNKLIILCEKTKKLINICIKYKI